MVFPPDMLSGGKALDKLCLLSSADGPNDRWRAEEGRTAPAGNALSIQACVKVGVDESMTKCWRRGIKLQFRYAPPVAVLQDYPSAKD